jgi:hypothetical protein
MARPSGRPESEVQLQVIEIMRFRLAPDVTEAEFVAADRNVQAEFAYQQPGLLRRTTARDGGGNWLVIDLWKSEEDAAACDTRWEADPVAQRFMSLVDRDKFRSERYSTLD